MTLLLSEKDLRLTVGTSTFDPIPITRDAKQQIDLTKLTERFKDVKIVPYTDFPVAVLKGTPSYQREVLEQIIAYARERGCDALITGNGG